jgi:hypothetical protein
MRAASVPSNNSELTPPGRGIEMAEEKTTKQGKPRQSEETDRQDSQDSDQSPADDETADQAIKPFGEKIGEDRDNLRRREEWFQRRSGGK